MDASFEAQFDQIFAKKLAYLKSVRNKAVLELGSKIIGRTSDEGTPVLTGDLRGSWYSTLGSPSSEMQARRDPTGQLPIAELDTTIKQWSDDGTLWMTNNLRYSEGVEFDHYSTQRPAGMVRVNTAAFGADFVQLLTGTGRTE